MHINLSHVAGDSTSIAAEPAQVASAGPVRQSSAINFNAALGRWDPPARPASARIVHKGSAAALANVKMSQPHVLQSMKAISAQAQPQQPSSTGQAVSGSEQHAQDLRPRSSDGILQRITVDRGPAKGQFTRHNTLSAFYVSETEFTACTALRPLFVNNLHLQKLPCQTYA